MQSKFLIFLVFIGLLDGCHAAKSNFVILDDTRTLSVRLANKGLTRISMAKDSIAHIFAYPDRAKNCLSRHDSGHLFIAPEGVKSPIYLTIISQRGRVQDLKIFFVAKPVNPLILKGKPQKLKISKSQVSAWLHDFVKGLTPKGFRLGARKGSPRIYKNLTARFKQSYWNQTHQAEIFAVGGCKSKTKLKVAAFVGSGEAGMFDRNILKRGSEARLVIIRRRKK